MKHRSFIVVLLALVLTLMFTGCESSSSSAKFEGNTWTSRKLAETMVLCGKKLTYPLTVETLGEDFSLSAAESSGSGATADLEYMGDKVCVLRFECAPDLVNDTTKISRLIFVPDDEQRKLLSVNGFTADDKMDSARKKIGEPTSEKGATLYYETKDNGKLEIVGGTEDKIYAINLYFDTGNNI